MLLCRASKSSSLFSLRFFCFFISSHCGSSVGISALHSGQFAAFDSQAITQASWNEWQQGKVIRLSPSSIFFKQIGHCCSSSGAQVTFSRGREAMNAFEVGGGGRSSNIPENASWSQLPESTKNLANWRSSSGAVPSAKGVQSCSSK